MKYKFIIGIFCALAFFGVLSAFDKPEYDGTGVREYQQYNFRKDTITNAEIDTIPIGVPNANNIVANPVNFMSLFTYDISILRASLSGTHNVKVYLDRSNTTTSGTATDWFTIDSTSATTATMGILRSTDATGAKYRLRVKGTGSQSSTYTIWSLWKKKN